MMRLKTFTLLAMLALNSQWLAADEIKSQADAQAFLGGYCIGLVNETAKAVDRQLVDASKEEWDEFMKQGGYISGLADVYGNLCKPGVEDQ